MIKCFRCRSATAKSKCADCGSLYCSQECFDKDLENGQHDYIQGIIYGFQYIAAKKRKYGEEDGKGKEEEDDEDVEPEYETGEKRRRMRPSMRTLEEFVQNPEARDVTPNILINVLEPEDTLAVCVASDIIFEFCKRNNVFDRLYEKHFRKFPFYLLVLLDKFESKKLYDALQAKLVDTITSTKLNKISATYKMAFIQIMIALGFNNVEYFIIARDATIRDRDFRKLILLIKYSPINLFPNDREGNKVYFGAIHSVVKHNSFELYNILTLDPRFASVNKNELLRSAAANGALDFVKLLLSDKDIDMSFKGYFEAVRSAISHDHIDVLKVLLDDPRFDPSFPGNEILDEMIFMGKVEMIKLLIQDKRVRDRLNDKMIEELNLLK